MSKNILKLYAVDFLCGIIFWYGIEKLFLRSLGISTVGIAINATVYIVLSLLLNIPSGIVADKWSRKYVLLIGIVSLFICSLILGNSHTFTAYVIGTAFWGIFSVCSSGTYQAIMYDSLLEIGREKDYAKLQGFSYGLTLLGVSVSSVFGGYIANHVGFRAAYLYSLIPTALATVILFTVREPDKHKPIEDLKLRRHMAEATGLLLKVPLLRYMGIVFIGAGIVANSQNEFSGLYYIALGFGAVGNGWINAAKWLSSSLGQFVASKFTKLSRFTIPLFFIAFTVSSLWRSPLGIILFCIAAFLDSVVTTNVEAIVQDHTPSHVRATTISALGFVLSLLIIPTNIVFGLLARSDVFHAYQFIAILGLLFLAIWRARPESART